MTTHVISLVSGFGWHVEDLARAAGQLGITFLPVEFSQLVATVAPSGIFANDTNLLEVDGVLARMMPPGSLEQVVFRMDVLARVEAAGVPVLNPPKAIEAAVDKYLTLAKLAASGLPVPPTWVGESAEQALLAFDDLGGDVVVKPLFGSEGRGLLRISERELARRAFTTLERLGAVLYLQAMIPHPGHDLRVFVLGEQVLGAMRRYAPAEDWRTNVAIGGRAEAATIDDATSQLARDSARAVGAIMAGVDLIEDPQQGTVVLEVNAVPGWKALASVTGVDFASAILVHLREARR